MSAFWVALFSLFLLVHHVAIYPFIPWVFNSFVFVTRQADIYMPYTWHVPPPGGWIPFVGSSVDPTRIIRPNQSKKLANVGIFFSENMSAVRQSI